MRTRVVHQPDALDGKQNTTGQNDGREKSQETHRQIPLADVPQRGWLQRFQARAKAGGHVGVRAICTAAIHALGNAIARRHEERKFIRNAASARHAIVQRFGGSSSGGFQRAHRRASANDRIVQQCDSLLQAILPAAQRGQAAF
ncbi:MAG TPA: hypothetical protein VHW73_03955 [Rudaea sp.]|nr:hypothetical protein [Rudaea sp.]